MPVLDTSVLIDKIRKNEEILENITEITVLEYPPVLKYPKFRGKIYYLKRQDLKLALEIQIKLRKVGIQKSVPDILIASICINRDEELITKDEDFKDISEISGLKLRLL